MHVLRLARVLFSVPLFLVASVLSAQSTGTGTITGTVSDASGATIANAHVLLHQAATGLTRSVITNEKGLYIAAALRAGEYQLHVDAQGFQAFEQNGITLESDSTRSINVNLNVGSVSETATVTTDPPALETSDGGVSTLVSGKQLNELALNGRNFTQFLSRCGCQFQSDGAAHGRRTGGESIDVDQWRQN